MSYIDELRGLYKGHVKAKGVEERDRRRIFDRNCDVAAEFLKAFALDLGVERARTREPRRLAGTSRPFGCDYAVYLYVQVPPPGEFYLRVEFSEERAGFRVQRSNCNGQGIYARLKPFVGIDTEVPLSSLGGFALKIDPDRSEDFDLALAQMLFGEGG